MGGKGPVCFRTSKSGAEMEYQDNLYTKDRGVATITINRVAAYNAFRDKRKPDFRKFEK
jgi:1,4-dihydroxy-2-naphthoyl-CoA synthase